jgi:hypothetical protein
MIQSKKLKALRGALLDFALGTTLLLFFTYSIYFVFA